jgi:hypothetical protein
VKATPLFPKQFYELIPALYPHLVDIFGNAGISLQEFCCLSIVKNTGKEVAPGVVALPLSDLKSMLVRTGEYTPSGANGFLTHRLQNQRKFLESRKISQELKDELFPDSDGYRDVLIVSEEGNTRLTRVNAGVEALFVDGTRGIQGAAFKAFLKVFAPFADAVVDRLRVLARERKSTGAARKPG